MKQGKIIITLLFIIILLSGCHITVNNSVAKQQCEQIIEYFNNKDIEGLKSMFCEEIKSTHNLDEEIKTVFDTFDGEITSYNLSLSGGGKDVDNGKVTRLEIGPVIEDIHTSSNKNYDISFTSYVVYKEKNMEGMLFLYLFDENGKRYDIGEYLY